LFRLLRYFSLTSAFAFVLLAIVLAGLFHALGIRQVTEEVQRDNLTLSRAFANAIWPRFSDYITKTAPSTGEALRARPETGQILEVVRDLTRGLDVVAVKIYRLDGLTVFATKFDLIGYDKSNDHTFALTVNSRNPQSEFSFRKTFNGLDGVLRDRHIVESYLPIWSPDGSVEGIFELYTDVSAGVASVITHTTWFSAVVIGILAVLYVVLFIIVRRADLVITSQARKLEAATQSAELANRAKSQFLANMSHELRTPLNAILGFSEIMNEQYLGAMENPKYREYSRDIHVSARLLLELINDVLDLSRIEAGKVSIEREPIEVDKIADECVRVMESLAARKGVTCGVDIQESLRPLVADPRAIRQILLNLLSNAVKFTPQGGNVTIAVSANNARHVLQVRDTGIGIPGDKINSLTDPFTKFGMEAVDNHEGMGLGLAIVKSLVDLHDGDMTIESEQGAGTIITVILPTAMVAN